MTTLQKHDVTVILNLYKRVSIFEKQLKCILNQTMQPKEIWICIFASPFLDKFKDIIDKYKKENDHIKLISSDINFKFYGRFQMALQASSEYVCFYDDDRFPMPKNI